MPLTSIEEHVLQLSLESQSGMRGELLVDIETILYVVAYFFAIPLAKVERLAVCLFAPFVPRSCLGHRPSCAAVVSARLGYAHGLEVILLSIIFCSTASHFEAIG